MSGALSDIQRDDRRNWLLCLVKYSIKEDGKTEGDPEVQRLIETLVSIPRGYFDKRLSKEEVIKWIKDGFEWK